MPRSVHLFPLVHTLLLHSRQAVSKIPPGPPIWAADFSLSRDVGQTMPPCLGPLANTGVVYDRKFGDQVLAFEPSGGLINSALVMRARPTHSWWSIITGSAIGRKMDGDSFEGDPWRKKMKWKDWRTLHPD